MSQAQITALFGQRVNRDVWAPSDRALFIRRQLSVDHLVQHIAKGKNPPG